MTSNLCSYRRYWDCHVGCRPMPLVSRGKLSAVDQGFER